MEMESLYVRLQGSGEEVLGFMEVESPYVGFLTFWKAVKVLFRGEWRDLVYISKCRGGYWYCYFEVR